MPEGVPDSDSGGQLLARLGDCLQEGFHAVQGHRRCQDSLRRTPIQRNLDRGRKVPQGRQL